MDECTFCTFNEGLVRVWRPFGTRFDEKYLQYVNRSGRRSVSCWGALTADGLSDLVRIHGHLDRFQYCDILEDNAIHSLMGFMVIFYKTSRRCSGLFWPQCSRKCTPMASEVPGPQSNRKYMGQN